MKQTQAIQFIKDELARRVEKNPSYSLRAFANLLQMNIGTISSMLNGKRPITKKALVQICDRLNLAPTKKDKIIRLVEKHKKTFSSNDLENGVLKKRKKLEHETYTAITEWYHWAILQLVRLDEYQSSDGKKGTKWFAAKLNITELKAKLAIQRLVDLGLLAMKDHIYVRTQVGMTTQDRGLTSPTLRAWQKNLRIKAIESLLQDPIEVRSMTSMCMAIDPQKLPEAKIMIEEFQERLAEFLEGDSKERAYQLTISLFPLDKDI